MRTSDQNRPGWAHRLLVPSVALLILGAASPLTLPSPPAMAEGPATGSAVTIKASQYKLNPTDVPVMPNLEVTVSQTKDLVSQGIQISYKGGRESTQPNNTHGGSNFLQIFQCWGEDPERPGHPDRRTCQYGGTQGYGASRDGTRHGGSTVPVPEPDKGYSAPDVFGQTTTSIPFVAWNKEGIVDEAKAPADHVLNNLTRDKDGKVVFKPEKEWVYLGNNQFFSPNTTNEITWAPMAQDGSGAVPFELQTGMQAPGLGCGNPVDDGSKGSSCWLVILPRGKADNGDNYTNNSGLWWDAWEHHLAVKLDFKPLGVRCPMGPAERQLAGSELAASAIGAWQPVVCQGKNGNPFVLAQIPESDALLAAARTEPSPLALTSRPLDLAAAGLAKDPVAYAPIAIGGVSVSFAVDSDPSYLPDGSGYDPGAPPRGTALTAMKLTPRLVAKLLTASYTRAIPRGANASHLGDNPENIVYDPEFRALNPEWGNQGGVAIGVSDALMPQGRSDLAYAMWHYVLSDPEAKAWLGGRPDPYGMQVNPWYSTNADLNPANVPLEIPSADFPKADPAEKPDTTAEQPIEGSGPVNLVTHRPYTSSFSDGAYRVLRGDDLTIDGWDRTARPPKFDRSARQRPGDRAVIALSTTPAASQYQTVTAALRNPAGEFVAPTTSSLAAAANAMVPYESQSALRRFDPDSPQAKSAKNAYPLAVPVYAALNPAQTDAAQRASYAKLIEFAATQGQQPGTSDGELPAGYAPLPRAWATSSLEAARRIRDGAGPGAASPSPSPSPPQPGGPATPGKLPGDPELPGGNGQVPPGTEGSDPTNQGNGPADLDPTTPGGASHDSPVASGNQPPVTNPAPGTANPPGVQTAPPPPAEQEQPGPSPQYGETPADPPVGAFGSVVPAAGLLGIAAALGIPLFTRLRRKP